MHYNMPLLSHSANISIRYNMNDKTAQLSCSFFGEDEGFPEGTKAKTPIDLEVLLAKRCAQTKVASAVYLQIHGVP